jgi:hypothetical protein
MGVIERIENRAVRVPLQRSVDMANRVFSSRDFVVVRTHDRLAIEEWA